MELSKNGSGNTTTEFYDICELKDGSYVAVGSYLSGILYPNKANTIANKGYKNGIVIKYTSKGIAEWAKSIGGNDSDIINSVLEDDDGSIILSGYSDSKEIDCGNNKIINNANGTNFTNGKNMGIFVKAKNYRETPEIQELTVENNRKEYKITTDVKETDGVKGGAISGEDEKTYEKIKYGDSNTKEIIMTPEENYEIIGITVNGEEYKFEENVDGTYKMPQFTNITENKHIEVTYALKDNKIIINKVDSKTGNPLQGAEFKLEQIEERAEPKDEIGEIVENGKEYTMVNLDKEILNVQGELTANGTYNFIQNEDGTLTPTNSKTYQVENGESSGKQNTTANSYIPIDLTELKGEYVVIVNAQVSSESQDYGYATITSNTQAPSYSNSNGRFMYISGNSSSVTTAKDYTSNTLTGGNIYYLHLGYRKDSSVDTGEDQVVINSIKIYETNTTTYNFIRNENGGYESNNQGKDNTIANSYIPIDLTNCTGKYNLTVNAKISSEMSDYGYATITTNTSVPSWFASNGRFIYINGTSSNNSIAKDYTTVLQGGQKYYLHLGYYKNSSNSEGEDKFTINNVKLELNTSELYNTEVTTNSEGKAIIQLPFGKYKITELKSPEGYELLEKPLEIEFRADGNHEITISNIEKSKIIVHHYLKTKEGEYTTTKVAEEDYLERKQGETYTTTPKLDLEEYSLEKDTEGNYVIPQNATGIFKPGTQEVIYYYEEKQVPLTVHHYIEGTSEGVLLKNGGVAQDVVTKGEIGALYQTTALSENELDPKYELSITPENSTGIYTKEGVTVTYYYKVKKLIITTEVKTHKETNEMGEEVDVAGGTISGQNENPYETVIHGEDSQRDIVARPNENYQVKDILVNGTPIQFTKEKDGSVILNKFINMTEDKNVEVEFERIPAKVIVHYYIEGTTNKVLLQDGREAQDVTQNGVVGDMYVSKPLSNVHSNYELVAEPSNASGIMQKDTIEVIYYYKLKATSILVHHYKENTTEKVPSKNGGEVEDEVIAGKVGESYSTNASSNIAQNYELVADPANKNGTMTESQIVVTYYYRLKTPNITNQVINKTGTDRITIANQEVNYTVTYRANVLDYIGNAEVTIVDTLPYAIDEAKSDLAGGAYDANARTITWKENVQNINSFANGGAVEVTKTFKVVYVGLDMNQEKVVNNVSGNIKLLTPEKTNEKVIGNQESTIYKAIISSEKLVDKQEAIEGEKVTYTVRIKNEGNLAKTVTLRDTLPAGLTFDKNTLIQVGNLGTVYTEQNLKNGIPVEVPAKGTVDVTFAGIVDVLANDVFSKTLENQATVDNELTNKVTTNVTKPNITAHKESAPSSGSKVVEGDEITYKIKVRNDGTREGRVTVKDTIPAGTTFVEGSIKIGDAIDITKNATDLANGINLTVGVGKEVAVEFKVTVNKLANGTKIKNTAYINEGKEDKKVPEEPEHTYVEPKAEQNITKNGTVKIESLEQEITYNIAYTARITDYKGNAKVVLVDKLPYAIDEARSDLAGRAYNAESNTITWEEPVENIQLTETKEVTINKTIKVVYTGINKDVTSVKNMVTGHIEYETPTRVSEDVTANHTTTTGFIINIPVSKVWEDDNNKLGQRPTKVVFKLTGSDGSEYVKEMAKPGTAGSTTTQDQANPNKWNNIFENLPKYDVNNKEIVYTLTEEEKTEGDLRYYDNVITDKIITNTNKYGKVTVHHYIINTDGSTTTTKVPSTSGAEVQDVVIEGKAGDPYKTESAKNINEKYELVAEKLPANATGTLEKYNTEKPQEVIYYYKLKPAKVIINYLEKDEDTDDSNNQVLENKAELNGYVDEKYNTNTAHRKETIEKEGKTYTLVSNSGNTEGTMTLQDISVTYYYLQNSKATVRYVERNPETGEIVKDLEEPTVKEGLVGDEFVTNAKNFLGYRLVESPEKTTINLSKEEQTLIYYYEPVYSGLVENHIDEITGKLLETEVHDIQIGEKYNIPSKKIEGYDVVETKLPENATGTMGGELITVNYYYIKKAVLEVNYIDVLTNKPLTEQIVDNTKHEGDKYTTTAMQFENYDLVEMPTNAEGTMVVETDENGKITNNKTVVTYYYAKKSAGVEEHHIDIRTNKEIEEPILHEGHIGDEYDIKAKDFLSYKLVEKDEEGNSKLPENAKGTMTEEKIVVNYYYNQPAKVVVHYVEKATGKELEEKNQETGELQSSQIIINGLIEDEYKTEAKEFEYYTLIETELPQNAEGKMKVEIVENEKGEKVVNNTVDVYYYYQAKPFNIGVEKEITGIVVNGERKEISNGKLEKVEIYRKKTEETSVQVEYKIKVRNTGEIVGTATIEENLPEGMKLVNNDGMWEEQDGKLIKVIPEIGAGETKEYTVLLNWEQTGENMGEKANEVKLVETGNVPGFVDNNDKDNTSKANVIISVETGEGIPVVLLIALVGLVGLETVTLRYAVVLTKKQKRK